MTKTTSEQGFISAVFGGKTHKDIHTCLFTCFLSQEEPKKVRTLVDLPYGKRAIGTKRIYKNKKDERGIIVRNKERLVAQGHTQEEGIDYDEVFALVTRIEAIRLFLAYALFKDFLVYQMDVKSAFLYGKIEEEVYVCQPPGFEDPEKELCTEFENMMHKKFQMSFIGEITFFLGLQVTQKDDMIFISQDKYVDEILKTFSFLTVKTANTPMETSKPLLKVAKAKDVDVYLYRLMIGLLMYLTSSRPDIMFVVCACARFQVTPKVSHLYAVKRIFRYLKGQPKLGLWYPKDPPFDLEAYTDSDYAGASLDKKSIIGGCQFLGSRLISWQYKKQAVVTNSTTEAEYVAAASKLTNTVDVNAVEVNFLEKPTESEGFEQIMNFLNANPIKYALTMNPTIYTSCIKKLWATAKVNTVNGDEQIKALVDKKKVIITETSVKSDLKLKDDEGTECLPNATIFEQLTLMGFVDVFLNKQVKEMFKYKEIYVTPSHTKNVFANIKRKGKDFLGRVTPLFPTMLVQAQQEVDEGIKIPTDTQQTPIFIQPITSQPQRKQKTKKPKKKDTELPQTSVPTKVVIDEAVYKEMYVCVERAATTATGLDVEQDRGII
nr:hypothetical protein [Tanacetum cinerariifolium]